MTQRKRSVLIFLALSATFTLNAQDYTKVWLNKKGDLIKDSTEAVRYGHAFDEGKLIRMDEYSLNGILKDTWYYSFNENSKPKFRKEGVHTRYYANGTDSLKENYQNNRRHGEYIVYYTDGSMHSTRHYLEGKLDGTFMQYYPDGSLRRKENYTANKCTGGKLFAEDGSELPHYPYEVFTTFKGGTERFVELLNRQIRYPKRAARERIQGRVLVEFIVDKEGNMINPVIVRSVDYELDKEALEAIKRIAKKHKWTPAYQDGKPVRVRFTAPVNFKI